MSEAIPPIHITDQIREAVNNALVSGNPMIIATVDADGQPKLSFRGSLQTYSDDQLGFWARNAEGDTLAGIQANPKIAMMYRSAQTRAVMQFHGRARIATDPVERKKVYDSAPEFERRADAEMKGVGVIVDLTRIEGGFMGEDGQRVRIRMANP